MIAQGDITRCVGDAIVLVVAEDEATLEKAKKLVKIDYEPLEPVRNIVEPKRPTLPEAAAFAVTRRRCRACLLGGSALRHGDRVDRQVPDTREMRPTVLTRMLIGLLIVETS